MIHQLTHFSALSIRDNLQFLVETTNLNDITPSFLTKCGVVVINNSIVGWRQRFRYCLLVCMSVCMYVCLYAYCLHVCMGVCMHVWMCGCMSVRVHILRTNPMCVFECVCECVCGYDCGCVCECVYECVCVSVFVSVFMNVFMSVCESVCDCV